MISVYGASGFVGSRFCNLYPDFIVKQEREERKPRTDSRGSGSGYGNRNY